MHVDTATPIATAESPSGGRWFGQLWIQVVAAIVAGALLGWLAPGTGAALKPLGDAFVALVKMIVAPVIFLTVVTGIAGHRDTGAIGRVVLKALGYFLAVSTLALFIGLAVATVLQPGASLHVDPAALDAGSVAQYAAKAHETSATGFLIAMIPTTLLSALTDGSILQALLVAVLVGLAASLTGEPARPVVDMLERIATIVFRVTAMLMRLAPIGAFGAIAFTVGKFGVASLVSLGALVATFYGTAALFVVVVLGVIARLHGFSIWRLLAYLKTELLLVLGTSSSEAALPALIAKMELAGCDKSIVSLVVPAGYSFNLDGTNIYMTLAALFIAQACGIHLSFGQEMALLGVAMISSKGAAGVTGAGFITLAATLSIVPDIPVTGMALILGVDRFMSQCRSLTNFIGNAVATVVVAHWENALDRDRLRAVLG